MILTLEFKEYRSRADLLNDVRLLAANAGLYNGTNNGIYLEACKLVSRNARVFESRLISRLQSSEADHGSAE